MLIVRPETGTTCADNEVGEIWISGPSVARGYWNRPEESARTFDARLADGTGPFLRTGDLGFFSGEDLYIASRLKDLIIIRGRNFYPQDVELTLEAAHKAVRQGCIAAFSVEVEGEERLGVAAEVDLRSATADEVTDAIRKKVAEEHAVHVHAVVLLEPRSIPKTSSGKIQRHACRIGFMNGTLETVGSSVVSEQPEAAKQEEISILELLRSATPEEQLPRMESYLRDTLARVVHIEASGIDSHSPLAGLGLDSLMILELQGRLEAELELALPAAFLWRHPTLAVTADRLLALWREKKARVSIPRRAESGPAPLTVAQQRMWMLEQLEPGSLAYHLSAALKLAGELDVTALERSIGELVRRHEVLRTTFRSEAGEPFQFVSPPTAFTLTPVDLGALPAAEREAEVRRLLREDAHRAFDLARGPLLRITLLRLGEREHVLLVTLHHIIADGWSAGVLVRELGELYGAFRTGRTPALAEPSLQYADYATWQRATLQGEELEAQRSWWSQRLADAPQSLELPTNKPRRATTGSAGLCKVLLPPKLVEGLEALARQESGTLYMAMLAGLKVLLSRYSGQDDFLVGSPFANRGQAGTEGVVGLFFEPLVFRANLSGNPTFRELLARTRHTVLEGFAHPHVPFESLGRRQPFQVLFNQLDAPLSRLVLPGLHVEALETVPATTELDLTVTLGRAPEGVWLEALYNADLFDASTLERLLGHLQVLLEGAVRAPESHVKTLPLLSAEEQRRVLVEWNATREGPVGDTRVHALIEAQAARTPEALAVVAADGATLTYAQLMERAHRLANFLRARGVRPEARVGLCLERSLDMVVALLGILEAGAAYVPLDSAYPAERLAHMVESSGIRLLLVHERTRGKLSGGHVEEVCLDQAREAIAASSAKAIPVELPPEAAAYVLFTSGSTGQPKGVVMSHRSLVNYTRASARYSPMSPGDRLLQFASISWDTSAEEIYTSLTQGGTLVLRPPAQVEAPEAFLAWCEAQGITQLNLPTAFWHELVASLEEGHGRLPRGLRWLIIGGERAVPERVEQWMRRVGPSVPLLNTYGITEVMAVATAINLSVQAQPEGREVCIGRPVLNVRTYVLDEQQQPVPVGVTGELYVGGEGVARGYLDQAELTAERFVPDPFATEPGQRLYRSGDKARWRTDGTIEYLGRGDSQVKVRGFRIEPGEIEAALLRHPRVHEVLVLVREDVPGDKQLVAYSVPKAGQTLDVAELKGWLAERLPPFMVPQALVALPALPLLPNGKVNRRALPAPQVSSGSAGSEGPRTPWEQKLAALWKELLRLEHVGVHDSFFELGGHSLLATRLVSRIRSAFQVELPLRALFEEPTLAGLAARLESALQANGGTALPPLTRTPRTEALPLSFSQQRLWFLHQFDPGSAAYNIPGALRLTGSLDSSALRNALTELVRRHEALRTTFHNANGQPSQRISEPTPFALPVVDLSSREDREAEVHRLAEQEAHSPFDLATGPLLRGSLLRLGENEHVLLLNMHHIVSDGWSMGVLVREVAALYEAFSAGKPSPLPELPVQYADYSVWQRGWLQGETLDAQRSWWRKHLEGAPAALELPTDIQRPSVQTFEGATVPVRLSRSVSESLKALCQKEGVTPFMALLATYQLLLSRYSGQEDITVGSPIAGRRVAELEGLIGFFVNTLALRTRMEGNPSFRQVLSRVKETTLGAFAHQDVPFEKLVEELTPTRTLGRSPLFQVLFALQNVPQLELQLPGFSLRPLSLDNATARFELELNLTETTDGFSGELVYNRDLFSAAFAKSFSSHFAILLEGLVSQPELPFHHLPLLSSEERQKVLVEWNHSPSSYPRDATIIDVFERQVASTPDAIALEFGEQRLSYRQLDEASNRLAHVLRARGVGPDSRVALALDRSLELIISLLGILKAGGAYVPLDTSYPRERLSFMLEDAQPALLVTTHEQLSRLPAEGLSTLLLEESTAELAKAPSTAPRSGITPRNLAYIDFTSGSTGRPKGVCIEHSSVLRTVLDARYAEVSAQQSFLLIAPISFDASTLEVWGPLLNGGRLVVFPPHSPSDLQELAGVLQRHSVTTLHLTSGLFTQMVDGNLDGLRGVRQLLTGGDVVSSPHVRRVLEQLRIPVTACYGPTEGTLFTSCFRMTEPSQVSASVPIGTPISGTLVYLLDSHLQPVPPGTPGELFISGDGLARGYLQQPSLTAERFLPNPFSSAPGSRLYRTGDLARHRSDGVLEFLGRADFQVKIRGFRIELGEVEAALLSHPEVREAIVIAREDSPGNKRLVGYVTGKSSSVDTLALRAYLQQRLPEYMVPSALMALEALPLTPNGKVDRKALPAPEARPEFRAFVPPSTPTEVRLATLWCELLGLSQVSALDDFFELGGHSLLATRLVSLVRSTFGVELPLRTLFEASTLSALAAWLESSLQTNGGTALPPLTQAPRTDALPLSFAQQRLWFLDQLEPGSSAYNMPGALRLTGSLDGSALRRALTELVRRHEALRTAFHNADGQPVQRISPPTDFPLAQVDLRTLPEPKRAEEVQRLAAEDARRPFDLAHGPLLRGSLLRLNEHEHVLLLSMHHIVSDGWSMQVLVREMAALYEAFSAGKPSPLPELPAQYADYSVWQRSWLKGETLESQLAWWRKHLEGAPAALEFPTDLQRPSVQSFRGATTSVQLSRPVSDSLKALCQKEGVTPFMALLAAYQLLLSRYSGQEDITVGSPIAGRRVAELEGLIGFFVNTLALRTRMEGNPSFRQMLARVKETTLGAFAHQDVPFEKLVEELAPNRTTGRSPLFQAVFALQNMPQQQLQLPSLEMRPLPVDEAAARFELELNLSETANGFAGELVYNRDLFSAAFAQRFSRHFELLLEGLVSQPEQPFHHLPLLTAEERQTVLVEWNRSPSNYPRNATIPEVFARQAAATPDAIAVEYGEQRLTYRQLDEASNRFAHVLRARGVGLDDRVAIAMDRSLELVISLVGILKAGGGYVPLDTAYPRERLVVMLQGAQAALLITTREQLARLPAEGLPTLLIEESAEELAKAPTTALPNIGLSAQNLAYIDFTSGSTGLPKGVCIEHRAVLRTVIDAQYAKMGPEYTYILMSPISFDASTLELWGPLLNGGKLAVFPAHSSPSDIQELGQVLKHHGVTHVFFTASLFAQLVDGNMEGMRSLKEIMAGGDVVSAPHARRAIEALGVPVIGSYGPTEMTVYISTHRMVNPAEVPPAVPIGRPLPQTQVYLLDRYLQPVPPGTPGELYAAGDGMARGYLQHPAFTAERFLPNPFSSTPGARMYRTGDLARHRSDGVLEFLGRADFQVKIRGFRIELGEVEVALGSHPEVREAIVLAREDTPGNRRLVGYVTAHTPSLDTLALRTYLQQRLPAYMVPSALVVMEEFPLTPNSKVDRKALPAPEARPEFRAFVPPSTPTEVRLASLWCELLGIREVSALDDFFELGGHSLLATRLVSLVRSTFQVELPLRALFESSTLSALAQRLDAALQAGQGLSLPPITAVPRTNALPLSFAQQRLWFLDQLEPGSPFYNMPLPLRVRGQLDVSALGRCFTELVRRHESLRTSFHNADGQPVQRISPPVDFPLAQVDLSTIPEPQRTEEVQRLTAEDARRPFDLANGPLLRATLVRVDEREHVLLLNMHHIVSDGWSMGVFTREIAALYEAFSAGRPSPLPELAVQYADYSVWQRSWLKGEALESQLAWWRKHLAGAPHALELPTDKPRPAVQSFRGASLPVRLPKELSDSLDTFCRREGVTPFMALLAAFQVLLSRYSGQDDISVGSPIAGRRVAELEGLIGFFVNTLVLRTRLSGSPSFREVLARVKETTLGAFAHQDIPFEKLVEELQPPRDQSRNPLFQVMFALMEESDAGVHGGGLQLQQLEMDNGTVRFDLVLSLGRNAEGLAGSLEYSTDLFESGTIERMVGHLHVLLEAVLAEPQRPVAELSLMDARERQRVLTEWNDTRADFPANACIHDLFEAQVARTPEATAVVYEDTTLTFRQLDERANQLARHLLASGLRVEERVGLCVERSLDMVVGMLGVLKAGGAFVPLDPGLPPERLAYMLENSGARLVITQERLKAVLPGGVSTLCLDTAWGTLQAQPTTRPATAASADTLAYVIYTSGSTGRPKGTLLAHRGLCNTALAAAKYHRFHAGSRILQFASFGFDASVCEVFSSLLAGASLFLAPREQMLPGAPLRSLLQRHRITAATFTPSVLAQLEPEELPLEVVISVGEACSPELVRRWGERLCLLNAYGPTEATVCATITREPLRPGDVPSIGQPWDNVEVYILDEQLRPVPAGIPGELCIGGVGLARGYLGNSALTAEKFVPHPFARQPGERLYRSGDRARFLADGRLEFLGRIDHQVKLRGFRIELGEIEATLHGHPALKDAAVVLRQDAPGEARLVAYVVPAGSDAPDAGALRDVLRRQLPEYMVPSAFVTLPELPLSSSGKVDRKALPAPDGARSSTGTPYVAPRDEVEQQIAELWAELLRVERVGIHDSFFDLGGHSLLATRLVARLRADFDVELPLRDLFEKPTVADMALLVLETRAAQVDPEELARMMEELKLTGEGGE
ncbi:non-ribosomal peptide synthetase [Archangium lansingense]|uniref:Non-ribosomal peptide synthase/polyketide synthase n=1 Tax=Archangium lansingense TaxID=2995310 RepID=A0ABT4AAN1_9BACT|nr:non-ribosomal peptide synthase/polyketide synthase [Archangium lansinium]MCY1078719.1 non-ribosomal peptide synthase/polyketide synthase [Archangium lansinium]